MKTVKIELSQNLRYIEIETFADLHLGDPGCRVNEIRKRIRAVKDDPHKYIILNGDLMNNATRNSVSDPYAERLSPMEQLRKTADLFEPVKDKILAITNGNHERRTAKESGIDLMEIIAREYGIADRYADEGLVLFLRFGEDDAAHHNRKILYTFYITHGAGGGRSEGSKTNALMQLSNIIDADIYIHSHMHTALIVPDSFFRIDTANNAIQQVNRLYISTAAELDYGGYGQVAKMRPQATQTPIIRLDGRRKEATAYLLSR